MASPTPSTETYCGLPVYALRDVLCQLSLPPPFDAASISGKWRCVVAPNAEAASATTVVATAEDLLLSEEQLIGYLEVGLPVRCHAERAAQAHRRCGASSLEWLTNAEWNRFSKPQIALRRGWGAPGTDIQDSSYHKMIASFDEVFHHTREVEVPLTAQELQDAAITPADVTSLLPAKNDADANAANADEVLDLQLFHRGETCSKLPVLGEELLWPSFVEDGAVCDTATWVSQAGMQRHWHLNDSGEFAMQAALPLSAPPPSAATERTPWLHNGLSSTARRIRTLLCPAAAAAASSTAAPSSSAAPDAAQSPLAAMLMVFTPKGGYDWVVHDDESIVLGKAVALDLFQTPDEALPDDAAVLPILTVAVLEGGGAPLVVPPNLAQMSIALADCVVVEQRRVSNLWLDDVSYFLNRCARWQTNPIIYAYLQQDLQDDAFIAGRVIPSLIRVFEEHAEATAYHAAVRRRAVCSLTALAMNEKHYGLADSTRASLLALVEGGNASMHTVLQAAPYRLSQVDTEAPTTLKEWLTLYWDMSWCWPKAGCVLRAPCVVHPLGAKLTAQQQAAQYIPVVYPPTTCSPVFGSVEESLEATVQQFFEMKQLETKPKDLMAYLRTRKQPPDDLLDELF